MEYLNKEQLRKTISQLSSSNTPFLFLIDFKGEKGLVVELSQLSKLGISCTIDGIERGRTITANTNNHQITKTPISFALYKEGFDKVLAHICHGDAYLLNLTYPTYLGRNLNMEAIYNNAKSRYKFMLADEFLFYSPEPFLRIKDGVAYSHPMKGTISASTENAREKLLSSKKELLEHYTIVDLIRNDLSMISSSVEVDNFRYVESISTPSGEILQTSTQISGHLPNAWECTFGELLLTLLPAGSVSGAPKQRCVEIIDDVEIDSRGFYTGIMGIYENRKVDSCVAIRYIEQTAAGDFFYRSGGGITSLSNAHEEYQELLTKIYVPTI